MARQPIDWEARWKEIQKENRKLAKRANQRLVRLERAAKARGMKSILQYAYKSAVKDIKTTGKTGKPRFRENVKLVDILDKNEKLLKGSQLYKANYMRQLTVNKMMKEFLGSASSTIGQGMADVAAGINKTIGIERIWDKVNKTINDKYLAEYDLRLSDNDMKRFWDSKKQAKLEKEVGSARMFAVAAVIKKFNIKGSRSELEKFVKDHIVLKDTDLNESDLEIGNRESRAKYIERLKDYLRYTDDEVLDDYVNKALKNGLNVNNIFIK